jgi:two-component system, chemotaxis family, sensor kinase CheA
VIETGEPGEGQLAALGAAWAALSERVRRLIGDSGRLSVEVPHEEFQELLDAIAERMPHAELALFAERLKHEPVALQLRRAADQAEALARRLDKGELRIEISAANQLRFPADDWAPFWAGFVHVVRNAVDHGLESAEERRAGGKSTVGTLRFSARTEEAHLVIELTDDGRGIDWERVRTRAQERGLPHTLESDLIEALFADGVSAAQAVTDVSGRGVGMSAVREAARALGGSVHVASTRGQGTTVAFSFPLPGTSERRLHQLSA